MYTISSPKGAKLTSEGDAALGVRVAAAEGRLEELALEVGRLRIERFEAAEIKLEELASEARQLRSDLGDDVQELASRQIHAREAATSEMAALKESLDTFQRETTASRNATAGELKDIKCELKDVTVRVLDDIHSELKGLFAQAVEDLRSELGSPRIDALEAAVYALKRLLEALQEKVAGIGDLAGRLPRAQPPALQTAAAKNPEVGEAHGGRAPISSPGPVPLRRRVGTTRDVNGISADSVPVGSRGLGTLDEKVAALKELAERIDQTFDPRFDQRVVLDM